MSEKKIISFLDKETLAAQGLKMTASIQAARHEIEQYLDIADVVLNDYDATVDPYYTGACVLLARIDALQDKIINQPKDENNG
ncbi:hypothetical protein [Sodaliphilus sp.]|uniref:hypothetical protein n=1 Tax=Sodaliphilus sp. TaxID=2815818 RepID=UPI00388D4D41